MKNVLDILECNYETVFKSAMYNRNWAKEYAVKDNSYWKYAFRDLAIAKEFKKAIKAVKQSEVSKSEVLRFAEFMWGNVKDICINDNYINHFGQEVTVEQLYKEFKKKYK